VEVGCIALHPCMFLNQVAMVVGHGHGLTECRDHFSTDEFTSNLKVWLCCRYLRIAEGGAGGGQSCDILFCTSVAVNVELFNDCKGFLGLAVLVTLDMNEPEGHGCALGDGLIDS